MKEILNKITYIDGVDGILDYKLNKSKTPLWFLYRWTVIDTLTYKEHLIESSLVKSGVKPHRRSLMKNVKKEIKIVLRDIYFKRNNKKINYDKTILFFETNRGRVVDGVYHENVYDTFVHYNKKNNVVLKPYSFLKEYKGKIDFDVCCREGFLSSRKRKKIERIKNFSSSDQKTLNDFLRFLEEKGNLDKAIINQIKGKALEVYKISLINEAIARQAIKSMKSLKLVILSEACYSYNVGVCRIFHEHNIPILEIQHGTVSQHPCYNYGGKLKTESIAVYQPDYFGAWTEYWESKISMFPKVIILGNKEIDLGRNIIDGGKKEEKRSILFCTSTDKDKDKDWIKQFDDLNRDDLELVVRLHPLYAYNREIETLCKNNIKVDSSPDIYTALRNKEAVVAERSTVLFEAEACGIRAYNIYNGDNQGVVQEGIYVSNMKELVSYMDCNRNKKIDAEKYKELYFGSEVESKYEKFLESIMSKTTL